MQPSVLFNLYRQLVQTLLDSIWSSFAIWIIYEAEINKRISSSFLILCQFTPGRSVGKSGDKEEVCPFYCWALQLARCIVVQMEWVRVSSPWCSVEMQYTCVFFLLSAAVAPPTRLPLSCGCRNASSSSRKLKTMRLRDYQKARSKQNPKRGQPTWW